MDDTPEKTHEQDDPSQAKSKLTIRLPGKPKRIVSPPLLNDHDWSEILQACSNSTGTINFSLNAFIDWRPEHRCRFWDLVRQLEGRCNFKTEEGSFTDGFEATLAFFRSNASLAVHGQICLFVVEAAACLHPTQSEDAARRINQQLDKVGAAKINQKTLAKQIRDLLGVEKTVTGQGKLDLPAAAAGFLEHLREEAQVSFDTPVLYYFQDNFYRWKGKVWELIESARFHTHVTQYLHSLKMTALTTQLVKDVVCNLKALTLLDPWGESPPFRVTSSDPLMIERPHWVVFDNGVVDVGNALEDPETGPHLEIVDSSYFNEISLPYEFVPGAKCPLWRKTLKQILPETAPDDHRVTVLQEFMGYTLLWSCRFQKYCILLGDGGNGKSTVTEIWQAMLGGANTSAVSLDSLGQDHRQYALKNKLANISGELNYLSRINEGLIKQLVSGEEIDVNRKHRDPVKFQTFAKLVVNTNEIPHINDATPATWDRMIIIPFEERFRGTTKEDKSLAEKLKKELPGIFLWALQGLRRLVKQQHFTACEKCEALKTGHRSDSDSAISFINRCCIKDSTYCVYSSALYGIYKCYCESTGRKPVGEPEFGKRLKRARFGIVKRGAPAMDGQRYMVRAEINLSPEGKTFWMKAKKFDPDLKLGYRKKCKSKPQKALSKKSIVPKSNSSKSNK